MKVHIHSSNFISNHQVSIFYHVFNICDSIPQSQNVEFGSCHVIIISYRTLINSSHFDSSKFGVLVLGYRIVVFVAIVSSFLFASCLSEEVPNFEI